MINLQLEMLSKREREILDLAIEGNTDQQIGNKLEITPSTVNSYWVRIRGKLGHLSRTELASRILQQQSKLAYKRLENRVLSLEDENKALRSSTSANRAALLNVAVNAIPSACVVFDHHCKIGFANRAFGQLFGTTGEEVEGLDCRDLFTGAPEWTRLDWNDIRDGEDLGLDWALFGISAKGREFRCHLLVGRSMFEGNPVFSCIVRPFVEELHECLGRAAVMAVDLR
jgi:PAS domain S-box-containing protein